MESLQQNTADNPEDLETANQEDTEEPSNVQDTSDRVQYEFVDMVTDSLARSHAMKMYWRQKKGARERREQNLSENQRAIRPLLPAKPSEVEPYDTSSELKSHEVALSASENVAQSTQDTSLMGLSDQLWAGLRFPFSGILFRETNGFPFQVTAAHRKLFYHC